MILNDGGAPGKFTAGSKADLEAYRVSALRATLSNTHPNYCAEAPTSNKLSQVL